MGTSERSEQPLFHQLSTKNAILLLSFIGGFVDATGYVKLFGVFTSSITGNLVVGCAALFGSGVGVLARLYVTLFFSLGAFATTIAATKLRVVQKKSQWEMGLILFGFEIVCIVGALIFGISATYSGGINDINSWAAIIAGSLLGLSMGVHNAAAQDLIANCPSTTVMTMTIVKASIYLGNAVQYYLAAKGLLQLRPPEEKPSDYEESIAKKYANNSAKFVETVQPLAAFIIGAMFGALLSIHMTFWSLFMPLLALGVLVHCIRTAQKMHNAGAHTPIADIEMESAVSPMARAGSVSGVVVQEEVPLEVAVEIDGNSDEL